MVCGIGDWWFVVCGCSAEAIESIEKTIVELGEMYKKLIEIVHMHEDLSIRIDENLQETLKFVDKGHTELLKANDSMASNKWLIIKIFAVLIFFIILWTFMR